MPPLSILMKPSSGQCPLVCDYCFYCDEAEKRRQASYGFMSEQTLKNVIRKTILRAEGRITYAYQGGEPTLRGIEFFRQALAFQRHYNKNGIRVANALQTNGWLLDDEWCSFLHDNHFLVGISIDGTAETHDLHRRTPDGRPTHERVLRSIELLRKHDVDFNILTVVNRDTAARITDIYKYYRKMGLSWQQYILCLDPLGEPRGERPYSLGPAEYGRFLITLFDLWYDDWRSGRQPYIRQFENYIGILLGQPPEACDQNGTCSIQTVVEADGSAYPCDFYMLDEYRLGSFNENSLAEMDEARRAIGFRERSLRIAEKCRSCRYYMLCRCGCQRSRDLIEADGTYLNFYCESYYAFFDACAARMQEIARETARRS